MELDRYRKILRLALPIIGGMASQNVLNLVDTAMVGRLGDNALAAVGFASFLNFLFSAFILGLSSGVQATAARRMGEKVARGAVAALNGGLLLALTLAIPWSLGLVATAPTYLRWLLDDEAVVAQAVPYLQVRLLAMAAMGANFAFRGYWNAVGKSSLYLRTLLLMHATNIVLNYVFIFGKLGAPEMGVTGAGLASSLATLVGMVNYAWLGFHHHRRDGFLRSVGGLDTLRALLRLSAPAGAQQLFFAAGMTTFMWIAAQLGTVEMAACHVLTSLLLVGVLPGMGCGLAAATLVGQSLGRKDAADAQRWGWEVVSFAVVLVATVAAPAMILPEWVLRAFIASPETRAIAAAPLRLMACLLPLDTIGLVLMHAMIGAGDTRRTFVVSTVLQWCVFLPSAWLVGPALGGGLLALWVAHVAYRQVQAAAFGWLWRRGAWREVSL